MTPPDIKELLRRREQVLGAGAELFYDTPIEIVRGEGAFLYGADGRRYLDLYNNVPCVGHGNPVVARAMGQQQGVLNVHNRYLHDGILGFAERLVALHHDGIESVVFSCTGTEANEVALALVRAVTGQEGIVCTDAAYHGSSGRVAELSGVGSGPCSDVPVQGFPFPDCFRPPDSGLEGHALTDAYLDRVREAISGLRRGGHGFAGLLICPILANEGLPVIPPGFMSRLADLVRAEGGLLIADEVQSGYGRTGHWWGYQHHGFEPDVVVTGKPMGNGLPLAATAASREHVEAFRRATGYFNTFASTPLQAAVGMAVLDEIERLDLVAGAADTGSWLTAELERSCLDHPLVGQVRGCGLFVSVDMVAGPDSRDPNVAAAAEVANRMKDAGFLLSRAGAHGNVVKIRPPLVFARAEAELFAAAFHDCLAAIHG